MPSPNIRLRINVLGAVTLASYVTLSLLSYVQTPALWRNHGAPQAMSVFDDLAARVPFVGLYRLFEGNGGVLASYYLPLGVATLIAGLLAVLLPRHAAHLDEALVGLLFRWSLAFAAACALSSPVFTQDFWLSAGWGRMVAEGANPYHTLFAQETVAGLPLDHFPMPMSYGPLWALLSGAVMLVSGRSLLVTAVLFKAVLVAAWIAALVLIERITRGRPASERCQGMVLIGWIPLSVTQAVAEGHNDIVMTAFALMWLLLLLRGHGAAPSILMASVLCKYTTGPLFLVDAIVAVRRDKRSWAHILVRYALPMLLGAAVFALFFRSLQFFDGPRLVSEWRFLQPRDAVAAFELTFGISLFPASYVIAAACVAFAGYRCAICFADPRYETIVKAALAIIWAVSLAGIAHLWPWYIVWMLALAAVVPNWWLSRFVVGLSLLAPFTLTFWWLELFPHAHEWGALGLYVGATLWAASTRASAGAADRHIGSVELAGSHLRRG